jgi:hypothetical protein
MAKTPNYYWNIDKEGKDFAKWMDDNVKQYRTVYGVNVDKKNNQFCLFLEKKYGLRMPHLQTNKQKPVLTDSSQRRIEFYKIIKSYPHNAQYKDVNEYMQFVIDTLAKKGEDVSTYKEEDFWKLASEIDVIEENKVANKGNISTGGKTNDVKLPPANTNPLEQNKMVEEQKANIINNQSKGEQKMDGKILGMEKKTAYMVGGGIAIAIIGFFVWKKYMK